MPILVYTNNNNMAENINTIIAPLHNLHFNNLIKIIVIAFEFSYNDTKRYVDVKNIVFENHYSNKFKITPIIGKQLGLTYMAVYNKSKDYAKDLIGFGIRNIQIYGETMSGEKIPLILEPNHTVKIQVRYEYYDYN